MKLNTIQQMMLDTGMLDIKLPVKSDKHEYEVVINGVWCDIGSHNVSEDQIRFMYDVSVCENCYEH